MIEIQRIELPLPGIDDLQREAHHEGYRFIDRLVKEWSSGENRFDKQGEVLRGCIDQGMLVAWGPSIAIRSLMRRMSAASDAST